MSIQNYEAATTLKTSVFYSPSVAAEGGQRGQDFFRGERPSKHHFWPLWTGKCPFLPLFLDFTQSWGKRGNIQTFGANARLSSPGKATAHLAQIPPSFVVSGRKVRLRFPFPPNSSNALFQRHRYFDMRIFHGQSPSSQYPSDKEPLTDRSPVRIPVETICDVEHRKREVCI